MQFFLETLYAVRVLSIALHNVYFVQYDAPASFMTLHPIEWEEGVDTGAYLGKKGWIQGHILGEITDLKFENHKNVKKNGYSAHSNKLGQIYVQWDTNNKN